MGQTLHTPRLQRNAHEPVSPNMLTEAALERSLLIHEFILRCCAPASGRGTMPGRRTRGPAIGG